MSLIDRITKTLTSWWQPRELPQEPPVPGRPGGAVGNSRRTESTKGMTPQIHRGESGPTV